MVTEIQSATHHYPQHTMQQQQGNRYSSLEERSLLQQRHQQDHHLHASAAAAGFDSRGIPVGMDMSLANLGCDVQGLLNQQLLQEHQNAAAQRKQREFIPDNKKDDSYWDRRRRNNEAAKRSREKRRLNDMVLEGRVLELTKENHILRAQLSAIRDKYGIMGDNLICIDQVNFFFIKIFFLRDFMCFCDLILIFCDFN